MTKSESNQIKGIAITFMLLLHLFNTYDYQHIYDPYLLVNVTPLTFHFLQTAVLYCFYSAVVMGCIFLIKKKVMVSYILKVFLGA